MLLLSRASKVSLFQTMSISPKVVSFKSLYPTLEVGEKPSFCQLSEMKTVAIARFFPQATLCNNASGAPFLSLSDGSCRYFSLSHSSRYLALLAGTSRYAVGVDIESFRPQIVSLGRRFLALEELALVDKLLAQKKQHFSRESVAYSHIIYYTQLWCAKEASYKALAELSPSVNFRKDYQVVSFSSASATLAYLPIENLFLTIRFFLQSDYCLAWTALCEENDTISFSITSH